MKSFIQFFLSVAFIASTMSLAQNQDEELKSCFEKFVTAQNAHDINALDSILSDSPNFLWITHGIAIWGREEAIKRFKDLYRGTWHLEPNEKELRIVLQQDNTAQIFVPILFSIGKPDQPAQETRFLMNQIWVREKSGWKITSILPIPAP